MDNITVDLGLETDVRCYDEAVLIGARASAPAEEWARRLDTINYEITCGLTAARRAPLPPRWRLSATRSPLAREALNGRRAWLVGGAVRDRLLGRQTFDLDVVVDGPPEERGPGAGSRRTRPPPSRSRTRSAPGASWRATIAGRSTCCRSTATRIEQDLGRARLHGQRDRRAAGRGERAIDPFGGRADLAARARCGWSAPQAFDADPLRVLRAARLACELRPRARSRTARRRARPGAPRCADVAPERVFAELKRHRRRRRAPPRGLALLDRAGRDRRGAARARRAARRRAERLPPPRRLRPHARGARAGRRAASATPSRSFGEHADRRGARCWPSRWPTSSTAAGALRFGALLHDAAKPQTRGDARPRAASRSSATTASAPSWRATC